MKVKKKPTSGSVKVKPSTLIKAKEICEKKGVLLSFYADQAIKEKNDREAVR